MRLVRFSLIKMPSPRKATRFFVQSYLTFLSWKLMMMGGLLPCFTLKLCTASMHSFLGTAKSSFRASPETASVRSLLSVWMTTWIFMSFLREYSSAFSTASFRTRISSSLWRMPASSWVVCTRNTSTALHWLCTSRNSSSYLGEKKSSDFSFLFPVCRLSSALHSLCASLVGSR